jgi:hypothetical protein
VKVIDTVRTASLIVFVVALGSGAVLAQSAPTALRAGQFVEGRVGSDEAPQYRIQLGRGEAVQIDVTSLLDGGAVDTRLKVIDAATNLTVLEDDNGSGSLDPRGQIFSREGGEYRLRIDALEGADARFSVLVRRSNFRPLDPVEITAIPISREGSLGEGQAQLYHFAGRAGDLMVIDAKSEGSGLDPQLTLFQGRGIVGPTLAFNDDAGRGNDPFDSQIRQVLPASGDYTAQVTTYPGGGTGTFRFSIQVIDTTQAKAAADLPIGVPVEARFDEASMLIETTGAPYKLYRFRDGVLETAAASGQRLVVTMRDARELEDPQAVEVDPITEEADEELELFDTEQPPRLDSFLELGIDTPFGFVPMRSDDDSGGDGSASMVIEPAIFAEQLEMLKFVRLRASVINSVMGSYVIVAAPAPPVQP